MKNKLIYLFTLLSFIIGGCEKDNNNNVATNYTLTIQAPTDLGESQLSNLSASFRNVSTNRTTTATEFTDNKLTLSLPQGLYSISIKGDIQYSVNGKTVNGKIKGYEESVNILGESGNKSIPLFLFDEKADFVIEEVFFAGTLTTAGKVYTGDQYFKIYNNSDTVLYADGLLILESKFTNDQNRNYTPDRRNSDMTIQAIYAIPGTGKDYPVQPGKSLLICDIAKDHRSNNPNSFNLEKADFEWYDESSNSNVQDVDNPDVTNLDKIYCYTLTIWKPNQHGNCSYAIARLGVSRETFLSEYKYDYTFETVGANGTVYPGKGSQYRIPNEWIIDAVNICSPQSRVWSVLSATLDSGYTYCGETSSDKTKYGKSVKRKVLSTTTDGRKILQDTNNSSDDFEANATPSLKTNN